MSSQASPYDVCIIGSGFSGSLLAWLLAHRGLAVLLIDTDYHPRFAIGESSTPLADFLLEQLAEQHAVPELAQLSRWGTWQQNLPHLRAGKKRGFSYFSHSVGQAFDESPRHENSWLVAASVDDALSDTHWMRSDVDAWFCSRAVAAGVELHAGQRVSTLNFQLERATWSITMHSVEEPAASSQTFTARMLVDASGGGGALGRLLNLARSDDLLHVRTGALYGHFRNVGSMRDWMDAHGLTTADDPFDPDDAAQHHLVENGWCWMLRFNEGTTSVGFASPTLSAPALADPTQRVHSWQRWLDKHPTLADLLSNAQCVAPERRGSPAEAEQVGHIAWLPRISRLWSQGASTEPSQGPWAMLPGAVGIVDPLHSTGIAHSLWGVKRLSELLLQHLSQDSRRVPAFTSEAGQTALRDYSAATVGEVLWIDRIVQAAYRSLHSFELFQAACGLYFVAAIHCERQMAAGLPLSEGFLLRNNRRLQDLAQKLLDAPGDTEPTQLARWLREQLAPWDDIGLYDAGNRNRIARSAAAKSE